MRVKQLELIGFKSFPNKTIVNFEAGVTAIVGPNGSGKSNLSDAIRWVLGEHNPRDVRAPRLEDIIFNGTDTKAPLSLAEVSLTIENDQGLLPIAFREVTITRRVYRSGESECLINQAPCRLKDIQELLLGTGLGGSTYAIIEQGHIDMILSSKPEERRGVFEEASGVAKYLSKKQETVRRLDEVEQHLTRITDITTEVRRQRSALERQAAKARQYKTQWEQLKTWELRVAVEALRQGEHTHQDAREQVDALKEQRGTLEAEKEQLLTSLAACTTEVTKTQTLLQEARTRLVETTSQIDQQTNQVTLKTRWVEELTQQQQRLAQEEGQLEERAKVLGEGHEQTAAQREALGQQHADLVSQRQQADAERHTLEQETAASGAQAEALKVDLFEAASTASSERNEQGRLTMRLHTEEAQLARIGEQQQTLRVRLDECAQREARLTQERGGLRDQEALLQTELRTVRESLSRAEGGRHELLGRLNGLRENVLRQQARVQLLEDVWRRYEGFPDAVKALLASPPEGVLGLVADLLEAQPGYERAVEAALGPLTTAIVVRDREGLRRCRAQIASRDLDAVHVVVLSDLAEGEGEAVLPAQEGVRGRLVDHVQCESANQRLRERLLGAYALVDQIDQLLSHVGQGRFVSQAGDRWDGQSWQVAGGRSTQSIRVGRKPRWEHAQQELQAFEQQTAECQTAWQRADEQWRSLQTREGQLQAQAGQLVPTRTKLDTQLTQVAHDVKRLQDELKTHELDQEERTDQQAQLRQAHEQASGAVSHAEAKQHTLEEQLKALHAQREQATQRTQQLLVSLAQLDTGMTSTAERQAATESRLKEIQAEQEQAVTQLHAKRAQATESTQRAEDLRAQLGEHRQSMSTLEQERARLAPEVDQVAGTLRQQEHARDQVMPQVLAKEQSLLSLTQRLQEQEGRLSELAFRRTRITERLREVYHIDEATLAAEEQVTTPIPEPEREALIGQVDRLKAKLEAMGPVSLGSVEEYDELNRRMEFLQTQQDDLLKAKEDLRQSITQINRTARAQFRDTFAKIREQFRHYFSRLFEGGEADLFLLDEEDVLESGVEIVARPPGKRLQNISLLSGGERALTAIALLFALFKVRPSPFCILDEIDAPLDEANVDRFTKVLEEFLSLSQFILITHNKKTITKADCLYGVTMEQAGVSKIVSVKLTIPKRPSRTQSEEAAVPAGAAT